MEAESVMRFNQRLVNFVGVMPPRDFTGWKKTVFILYLMFIIVTFLLFTTSLCVFTCQHWGNVQVVSATLGIVAGTLTALGDILYFMSQWGRAGQLMDEMRTRFIAAIPLQYSHLPLKADRRDKIMTWLNLTFCNLSAVAWLKEPIRRRCNNIQDVDMKNFLLPAWTPFDVNQSPASEFFFLFQLYVLVKVMYCIVSIDTYVAALMSQLSVQLSILSQRLSSIQSNDIKPNLMARGSTAGSTAAMCKNLSGSLNNVKETNEDHLVCLIQRHHEILEYAKRLDNVAGLTVFFPLLSLPFILCTMGIQMTEAHIEWEDFIKYGLVFLTALNKLFMYCWYGQRATTESLKIPESAYESRWIEESHNFKRLVFMITLRSQKPVVFTAWRFYNLSFVTFARALNTTYSYFTLLHKIRS